MNALLLNQLRRLRSGLARKSIQSCSQWSEMYRVMPKPFPGPWSFKYHPWLRTMQDSTALTNIGQKAAQMGFTEAMLNIAFYTIDILNEDVLYALPNMVPDAAVFSKARFDTALELSAHLKNLFSNALNVHHKQAGANNLYVRGSQTRGAFKSISTPKIILDETDEMNQDNVELVTYRSAGQLEEQRLLWMISTPSVEGYGINAHYNDSTQEHFFFQCPHCSLNGTPRWIELIWPDNIVLVGEDHNDPRVNESHLICTHCKNKLDHNKKIEFLSTGKWFATYKEKKARGFGISQLYSSVSSPGALAAKYLKSKLDAMKEQEFHNSTLGMAFEAKGSRISLAQILEAMKDYTKGWHGHEDYVTMGIDVGKRKHISIDAWDIPPGASLNVTTESRKRKLYQGTTYDWDDLPKMYHDYGVRCAVIDSNPETHMATQFCNQVPNAYRCFYGNNVRSRIITISELEKTLTVDRTCWFDATFSHYKNGSIWLPKDIDNEYKENIQAMVRKYETDDKGNVTATYLSTKADHYAHSDNYSEIALKVAYGLGSSEDIVKRIV